MPLLKLDRVSKVYKVGAFGGKELLAVRDVSFEVQPGEVIVADRRERQRQEHDREDDPAAVADHARHDHARRRRRLRAEAAAA